VQELSNNYQINHHPTGKWEKKSENLEKSREKTLMFLEWSKQRNEYKYTCPTTSYLVRTEEEWIHNQARLVVGA